MENPLSEVNWGNKGVIEALLFVLLCIALAIGSVLGKQRFYKSAAVHMTLGVGFGAITLWVLSDPSGLGFVELLSITVLMGFMLVWMSVQWHLRTAEIQQYLAGVALRPRPVIALMSFEAACLAGILSAKLGVLSVCSKLKPGFWTDLLIGGFSLAQFVFYMPAIIALLLAILVNCNRIRSLIIRRRTQRKARGNHGS